jgi:acyl-coenzyme A synthetase/AMP-(fatty) acid ligase
MNIEQLKNYEGICIIEENNVFSYPDLAQNIAKYEDEISAKINKGDVVCIQSDYSFESISLFLALLQHSCIVVPVVPTTDSEFELKIKAAFINKIITINETILHIEGVISSEQLPENYTQITEKNNSGLVLFSSGTTGVPKVMVHNLTDLAESLKPPKKIRNLNFLLFLLFDHIGGINTLLNCLNNGSAITIPANRNAEHILQLIQDKKIQILPTSPTFLNLLLMTEDFEAYDLSSLKMITYGTERMPQSLLDKLKLKIPTVKFLQTFGTSETGILKTESKSSTSLFFKIVDPDYQFKIENDQLFLKSKNQVQGYLNQKSDQFTDEGWFATGDLVETDGEGYLKIIGRLNKIINVGGLKVLPKEVEDVILQVPNVIDATVFSRDNAITGQMVCAEVVISENADKKEMKKLISEKCRQDLDKYKVPSKIIITNTLAVSNRFKKGNIK